MSGITATRRVQDVYDHVTRQFGDESGVQITKDDIIRWVNQGQDEIFRRTKPIKAIATANLVGGQRTYMFPDNILEVQALHVNGKPIPYKSFQEAEQYSIDSDPQNIVQSDIPEVWYEWGGNFMFWPTPAKDQADGITIYYIPSITQVTLLSELLSVPDKYFNALLQYVLSQAYELDENWEGSARKSTQFDNNLDTANSRPNTEYDVYPTITILEEDQW